MKHAMRLARVVAIAVAAVLSGCDRPAHDAVAPPPVEASAEATGHYCGMLLESHEGPKGQIHLASRSAPVWFSSVRDTIAFLRLPEEARDITAVYVNDMARAKQWDQPEPGTWIEARSAWFVIDSDKRGGMGAPEAVPFSDEAAAKAFSEQHKGRVVRLDAIPDAYVIGPVDHATAPAKPSTPGSGHPSH